VHIASWHIASWKKLGTAAAVAVGAVVFGVLGAGPAAAGHQDPADQGDQGTTASTPAGTTQDTPADDGHGDRDTTLGRVVSDVPLNVRKRPTTASDVVGGVRAGATVTIACKSTGEEVDGNSVWYRLADRSGWVTARYVHNMGYVPYCS
jgi:uncharacterized protein YgiM (DUF1202 family)